MDSRGDMNAVSTGSSSTSDRTVCKNWLEGNCQETDDTCATGIHRFDLSRMPICPSIERNEVCTTGPTECIYRHQSPIECIFYKMGFCPNGLLCSFTHVKQPGPPPPISEMVEFARLAVQQTEPQHEEPLPAEQSASIEDDGLCKDDAQNQEDCSRISGG